MIVAKSGGEQPPNEESKAPNVILSSGKSALSKSLPEFQQEWLLNHCVDRFNALYDGLTNWRGKLKRFEKMADDCYEDRKTTAPDPNITDAARSIFEKQNNTLGVVSGFCDFVFAQASDDLFGTRPWLQAKPQGSNDVKLAQLISAHSQWKFDATNIEESLTDALKISINLGIAFVKPRWIKEVETYEETEYVAYLKTTKSPILDEDGEFVTKKEDLDERIMVGEFDGKDIEWKEMLIESSQDVFNNVSVDVLDFNDVAFDQMAPELDLRHTDFFHRFRMGVLDIISFYGLDDEQASVLRGCLTSGNYDVMRAHRGERDTQPLLGDNDANPQVTLVEGFVRCDPFQNGDPKRIQTVFIPELRVMLSMEYLRSVSPEGILPVFPVRCFKTPRRLMARGYWERCEDANNAVDIQFNSTTYNDRKGRNPIQAFDPSKFADKLSSKDLLSDPDKVYELMPDSTLETGIQFLQIPNTNTQSIELLNQMHQLMQMRFGITSAAQGEIKGVPSSNTATGVRDLTTRGAVLVKVPISQMSKDIRNGVEYSVHLNYENLDKEEVFVWGDGEDSELLTITPGDVKGLRANVSLTMSQSQNIDALEDALGATKALLEYIQIPEVEKKSARRLYIQILRSYGFTDAEKIIREAIADPMSLLEIVPENLQIPLQAAMQQAGMLGPEMGVEESPEAAQSPEPLPPVPDEGTTD